MEQLVARQAHNLEVTCSSHVSATITLGSPLYRGFPSVYNNKVGRISDDVSGHIGCVSEPCESHVYFRKSLILQQEIARLVRIGCCQHSLIVASAYRFAVIITLAVGNNAGVETHKVFKGKT